MNTEKTLAKFEWKIESHGGNGGTVTSRVFDSGNYGDGWFANSILEFLHKEYAADIAEQRAALLAKEHAAGHAYVVMKGLGISGRGKTPKQAWLDVGTKLADRADASFFQGLQLVATAPEGLPL